MSILVAVPTFETITPETFKSIFELRANDIIFDFVKGYDCAKARNEIAKRAVDGNYSHVLMVDSDILLPKKTLEYMLEKPVDICLGVYPQKNTTEKNVELFKPGTRDFVNRYKIGELIDPRVTVKGGGLGCALIATHVFRKLAFPWFKFVVYDNGSVLSEDLYFCNNAFKAGIPIEADTRVRCGHLTRKFQFE